MEAYNNYYLELDNNNFENIAWSIKNKVIKVTIDPNQLKRIEIPVSVMGEVSGTVSLHNEKGFKGESRIIVNIYNFQSKLVTRLLTESDGYFSYIGLKPGNYTASIDTIQLHKLNMKCINNDVDFTIHPKVEGDVVDTIRFVLNPAEEKKVVDKKE